jgi:hypothetical protein
LQLADPANIGERIAWLLDTSGFGHLVQSLKVKAIRERFVDISEEKVGRPKDAGQDTGANQTGKHDSAMTGRITSLWPTTRSESDEREAQLREFDSLYAAASNG